MQMSSFYRIAAMLTLTCGMAACVQDAGEDQEAGADTAAAAPAQQPAASPGAPSDAEIAHIAKTANDADIDGGNLAKQKAQNEEVRSFANLMISDHTAANQAAAQVAQSAGLTPADNPTSQQMMQAHQTARQQLQSLSGAQFDSAYIAHEVDMHQQVLSALDQTLIPNAQNAELRNVLTQVRATVEAHLNRARDIQGKLH
jgi:putative membrane protein